MKAKIDEHIVKEIRLIEDQLDRFNEIQKFIHILKNELVKKKETLVALLDVESGETL